MDFDEDALRDKLARRGINLPYLSPGQQIDAYFADLAHAILKLIAQVERDYPHPPRSTPEQQQGEPRREEQ